MVLKNGVKNGVKWRSNGKNDEYGGQMVIMALK